MSKATVFVPAVGYKEDIEKYLTQDGVKFIGGLPVTDGIPVNALLYDVEVQAKDFIQDNYFPRTPVNLDVSYLDEFEIQGKVVGWEVEVYAFEETYIWD